MSALKKTGIAASAVVPVSQLGRAGFPGLLAVILLVGLLAVFLVGTMWWVIGSDDRSHRVERLLTALRGTRRR
jgi:hypothetical protein